MLPRPMTMFSAYFAIASLALSVDAQTFDCDPCLDRPNHVIKAFVHGTKSDTFWLQVQAAMRQAQRDMRVTLQMDLYDELDFDRMAADIEAAAMESDPPEALIVTVPSESVQTAVAKAVTDHNIPVFGFHTGYEVAENLGMLGFVAMDQQLAGDYAASHFRGLMQEISNAAFFTTADGNSMFEARREGFENGLNENNTSVAVKRIVASVDSDTAEKMNSELMGCPYDVVLLASAELLPYAINAYETNDCSFSNNPIATFDTSTETHEAISTGKLAFTISQQQNLQGALVVMMATIYATTGKALAPSSESKFGMQSVGPLVISSENLPTDTTQSCENDAFPVCPNNLALDGTSESSCECTDRKKIRIAGVLHAVTTDGFWDVIYVAIAQAADDFGIDLELDRFEPEDDPNVLHTKMAAQIETLCKGGVDGIFVTIPNESVLDAIKQCQSLNVPVLSINAGPEFSKDLDLIHHIGMVEYNAGVGAGRRMVSTGQMTRALCLMHAPNNVVLTDRCGGFREGVGDGVEYLGDIEVPDDNAAQYMTIVEQYIQNNVNNPGDWDGIGIMLAGQPQIVQGLPLKDKYPGVLLGAFDTDEYLYAALDEDKILFGIDQGPYLQGYLPVPLLVWQAYTKQELSNHLVESGPDFIDRAPSDKQKICQESHYAVCEEPLEASASEGTSSQAAVANQGAIIAVSVIAAVLVITTCYLAYRVHTLKKYVRQVRDKGEEVPPLSLGSYCGSTYKSAEQVVADRKNSIV